MLVRSPADLGAVIRDRRKQLKLDQLSFAKRIGVSRQWVVEIERGHPRAELALVLRAIDALDVRLDARVDDTPHRPSPGPAVDINAIVAEAKKKRS
jgi:HTH-type transcriptional regulator / antitoxin HipB